MFQLLSLMVIVTLISTTLCVLSPSSKGRPVPEPSPTYLVLDAPLANRTSQIAAEGNSLFFLLRRHSQSQEYVWLRRNNSDPAKPLYQVPWTAQVQPRNSNKGAGFLPSGHVAKGFLQEAGELAFVVSMDSITGDLYVLCIGVDYRQYPLFMCSSPGSTSASAPYYTKYRKRIPKTVQLAPEVYVKSMPFEQKGKRIIVAGTSVEPGKKQNLFVAVFNTFQNTTELLWEDLSGYPEIAKAIELDLPNNQAVVISEVYGKGQIESKGCTQDGSTQAASSWNVLVRCFNLNRTHECAQAPLGMVQEWTQVLGHPKDNHYAGSGVKGNFMFVGFNTEYQHIVGFPQATEVEFEVLRLATGEGFFSNCQMVLNIPGKGIRALDMFIAGEMGVYVLAETKSGTLHYVKDTAQQYAIDSDSISVLLFAFDDVSNAIAPVLTLLDVESYPVSGFVSALPTRMFPSFPSNVDLSGVPDLYFVGSTNLAGENSGLLFYSSQTVTSSATSTFAESKNPFVTSTGCTANNCKRCLKTAPKKCVQCMDSGSYYLSGLFTCSASTCPNGYFLAGPSCLQCHYTCGTCDGPRRSDCLSCDSAWRDYDPILKRCTCKAAAKYTVNGECKTSCKIGQAGVGAEDFQCRDRCPGHTLPFMNYGSAAGPVSSPTFGTSGDNGLLQFSDPGTGCGKLPGPAGSISVPTQFTISLWVYRKPGWTDKSRVLLWGFNAFSIICTTSSGVDSVQFVLKHPSGSAGDLRIPTVASANSQLVTGEWNFIAASLRKSPTTGLELLLYVTTRTVTRPEAGRLAPRPSFAYPEYSNYILLGCSGVFDTVTKALSSTLETPFEGYVRELAYQTGFHELTSLQNNKLRVFDICLQTSEKLLSYWRLDSFENTGTGYKLKDNRGVTANIGYTGNPQKSSSTEPTLSVATWDDLGTCIDIFSLEQTPEFSLSPSSYVSNTLEFRMNQVLLPGNSAEAVWSELVGDEDRVEFFERGCSGTLKHRVGVRKVAGKVAVDKDSLFPLDAFYGRMLDVCYYSSLYRKHFKLGQIHTLTPPQLVYPGYGASEKAVPAAITFSLQGGEQTEGDTLVFYNMELNPVEGLADSILLDESSILYRLARTNKGYTNISSANMDPGVYTLLWRPGYMRTRGELNLAEYKNLFVTWTIQAPPKVKFAVYPGDPTSMLNNIQYKSQMFYINLVGPGQADGDQILLVTGGCTYSKRKGNPLTRRDGSYPPIWLGDRFGVTDLGGSLDVTRLYVCWRPSVRASKIDPRDDTWTALSIDSATNDRAYIRIGNLTENKDIPEIEAINPPLTYPVLRKGENVWFQISNCESKKVKPYRSAEFPGRIQILHLNYTASDHSSYITDVVWEQTIDQFSTVYTVGKLFGDPLRCNYTLTDLRGLSPGHTYRLVIYSKSFMSSITNEYLLGNMQSGVAQFQYEFRYQETAVSPWTGERIAPGQTEATIAGTGLGDVQLQQSGFTEVRRLFGVRVSFVTGCSYYSQDRRISYPVISFRSSNPSAIRLTGLELKGCTGSSLTLGLTLFKYTDTSTPLLSIYNESVTVGTISCDPSCGACSGITKTDCTSCSVSTGAPYLHKGACLSQCPSNSSMPSPVYLDTNTVQYFECLSQCPPSRYFDSSVSACLNCSSECRSCTSGLPMSCNMCDGYAESTIDSLGRNVTVYMEKFFFRNMCMTSCPVLENDLSPMHENLISTDNYTHTCLLGSLPSGKCPVSIAISPLVFMEKLDLGSSIKIRASLNDSTQAVKQIYWYRGPAENVSVSGYTTSEKRLFVNYDNETLNKTVVELNGNAFNQKKDSEELRVIVKAYTNDSLAFDIAEVFGNTAPELNSRRVAIQPGTELSTMSSMNITLTDMQDTDDIFERLNIRVTVKLISLVEVFTSTKSASSPKLPTKFDDNRVTLFSRKLVPAQKATVQISDLCIPPLIDPEKYPTALKITCEVTVTCRDREGATSKFTTTVNVTETYSESQRSNFVSRLVDRAKREANTGSGMTWDSALLVANAFLVMVPAPRFHNIEYGRCSRDSHCGHGKCVTTAGRSECVCSHGYLGEECMFEASEYSKLKSLVNATLAFLNHSALSVASATEKNEDPELAEQTASVLAGILINPSLVAPEYLNTIIRLCELAMANLTPRAASKLESEQMHNVMRGIDSVMQFVTYHLRSEIYDLYLMNQKYKPDAKETDEKLAAEYTYKRGYVSSCVMAVRNALYRFANILAAAQYAGADPFIKRYNTFEVFIMSVQGKEALFSGLGDKMAIEVGAGSGFVRFPASLAQHISVPENEEFRIRIVNWIANPYAFSYYHPEVVSYVQSLAIFDHNMKEIAMNLTDPIVAFLPFTNSTKNLPEVYVSCKQFNGSMLKDMPHHRVQRVDVGRLNMTDTEKRLKFPEWDPEVYTDARPLVVETVEYYTTSTDFPEFVDASGVTSYGTAMKLKDYVNGYIPCAVYQPTEVAAVLQRKRGSALAAPVKGFYNYFDPMDFWKTSLGFYMCLAVLSLFGLTYFISGLIDQRLIPQLEKEIELNRAKYTEDTIVGLEGLKSKGEEHSVSKAELVEEINNLPEEENNECGVEEKQEQVMAESPDLVAGGKDGPAPSRLRPEQYRICVKSVSGEVLQNTTENFGLAKEGETHEGSPKSRKRSDMMLDPSTITLGTEVNRSLDRRSHMLVLENVQEEVPEKMFADVQPGQVRVKEKDPGQSTEDIFSPEHIERREQYQFSFRNSLIQGSMYLNLFLRTNVTFLRTTRTILVFLNIYFQMFWSAVFVAGTRKPINQPEDFKRVSEMVTDLLWIPFVTPIFSMLLLYLFAGLFKVADNRVIKLKTFARYKRLQQVGA